MTNRALKKVVRRSALAVALSVCFVSGVQAQSNTTGSVFGQAEAGSTIVVENSSGLRREVVVGADGRYRITALPIGNYTVSELEGGTVKASKRAVVTIGSGADVSFVGASQSSEGAITLEGITVTAAQVAPIDVSSVDTRTTLTADDLDKLPLAKNITAAALLAPGVISASPGYGNVPSFNGSSAAENAYYINGLSITNPLTAIGFASLPYSAIAQEQVITGGYGAEFGRSTGGVINIVTKRGSNDWAYGGKMEWIPSWGRSDQRDIKYPNNGYGTDGMIFRQDSAGQRDDLVYGGYASGPIIKDRLFFYAAGEWSDIRDRYPNSVLNASPSFDDQSHLTKWIGKIDWQITDNHLIEFTQFQDKTRRVRDTRDFDPESGDFGDVTASRTDTTKTDAWVARYTGYFGDNFSINALYGKTDAPRRYQLDGYDPTCPRVTDSRGTGNPIRGCQPFATLAPPNSGDKTEQWRFDAIYTIGDHEIHAGLDNIDIDSFTGTVYAGPGHLWNYLPITDPNAPLGNGNPLAPHTTNVVRKQVFASLAGVRTEESAQYIEDRWQVTDKFLLSLGVRNEQFSNYNGSGEVYAEQRHQLAPRVGFSWDMKGDSSFKLFGNAGRYHLPLPNNVAVRGAAASTFTRQEFEFSGFDPRTGAPIIVREIGPARFVNGEDGTAPDPRSVAAENLKASFQDEVMLGFEAQLNPSLVVGARGRYRRLQSTIDDFCDGRSIAAYAEEHGIENTVIDPEDTSTWECRLFNPGEANVLNIDLNGDGTYERLELSKEDLGFPELKRAYAGLDLWVEKPYDGKWYGRLDYTYSHNYGNAEGLLKSDIEQVDVAVTQDWDAPELMAFSNGSLPNDRRHQIKAYGYWTPTEELLFSTSLVATSGRPKNCFGYYLNDEEGHETDPIGYGSSYLVCDGVPAPRGSKGRLPWTINWNLGAQYKPVWAGKQLTFAVDAINVLNRRNPLNIDETYEDSPASISSTYGMPLNYNAPRYLRFSVRYDFKP